MKELLYSYSNGNNSSVELYADGTKIRKTNGDASSIILDHPEQMDLKITDWCDAGCGWCHESSTIQGAHADLSKTLEILKPMVGGTEIAIGGGDPLSHPDFSWFVRELRSQGVVPAVTINGRHVERSEKLIDQLVGEKALYGVGISYFNSIPDICHENSNAVMHFIAGVHDPMILVNHKKTLKVLILGYKSFGRGEKMIGIQPDFVKENIQKWYRLLPYILDNHHLSFDNLAIDQLKPYRLIKSKQEAQKRYMGKEGLFSMYVDAVKQEFALCSYSPHRFNWSDFEDVADMFQHIRKTQGFASKHNS